MEEEQFRFGAGYPNWVYHYKWKIIGIDPQVPLKYRLEGENKEGDQWITVDHTPSIKEVKILSNTIEE